MPGKPLLLDLWNMVSAIVMPLSLIVLPSCFVYYLLKEEEEGLSCLKVLLIVLYGLIGIICMPCMLTLATERLFSPKNLN